jgi:hypothetical protein
MNFIRINPTKNRPSSTRSRQSIRAVFSQIKGKSPNAYNLILYIGKEIAEKLNAKAGDKIAVSYDQENNRRLLIEKADEGYTLTKVSNKDNAPAFRIMLQWQIFTPEEKDFQLREVLLEKHDNGYIITV